MKNLRLALLMAVIVIQLFVPVYMIAGKYDILRNGEQFKFKVYPVDPYDAFRGRYVNLNARQDIDGNGKYGLIAVDAEGFAYIKEVTDQKPRSAYIKSGESYWFTLPIDRYYMDEKLAPKAEMLTRQNDEEKDTYVTVRVKNGNLVVSGLFIDDVAIEDIINNGGY